MKAPPMSGPKATPSCPMAIFVAMNKGCRCGGRTAATTVNAPLMMPDAPKPAMARPTINIADDWAAPQIAEPTSKMKKNAKKVH